MEEKHTVKFGIKKQTVLIGVGIIILLLVLFLLGVLILVASNENGTVIVRGEVLANIPIRLDPPEQNILIPFVMILRELGYEITPQDQSIIILADDEQKFVLNLEELSLFEYGEPTVNYLESPPGFYYSWCARKGNDIELDIVTFNSVLVLMKSEYRAIDIPKLKTVFLY